MSLFSDFNKELRLYTDHRKKYFDLKSQVEAEAKLAYSDNTELSIHDVYIGCNMLTCSEQKYAFSAIDVFYTFKNASDVKKDYENNKAYSDISEIIAPIKVRTKNIPVRYICTSVLSNAVLKRSMCMRLFPYIGGQIFSRFYIEYQIFKKNFSKLENVSVFGKYDN